MSSDTTTVLFRTTKELISEHAFKVVLWVGVALCTTVCLLRLTSRLIIFGRLLLEDYLILLSTAILIGVAGVLQRFLGDIYMMMHVENGVEAPGADFEARMLSGLKADGAALVMCTIGVWLVKINFLVFFHRLGHQIKAYLIFWWIALFIVVGCGATLLGLIPYQCTFGSFTELIATCATSWYTDHIYTMYKVSICIDVLSDVIIICFPVVIVWRTKMSLGQKLLLTSVFLLVAFNIAVTIVRGSIFGGVYKQVNKNDRQVLDTSWAIFWYYIEFMMSLVIASFISFRSIWVSRRERARTNKIKYERMKYENREQLKEQPNTPSKPGTPQGASSWHKFKLGMLDTLSALEGTTIDEEESMLLRLRLPSSRMTVDFSQWGTTTSAGVETKVSSAESQETINRTQGNQFSAPQSW